MDSMLTIFASYIGVMGFIYWLSKQADDALNPKYKVALTIFLSGGSESSQYRWLPDFNLICDLYFGDKYFSSFGFFRSALISIVTFILFYSIVGSLIGWEKVTFVHILTFSLAFPNLYLDYLSVAQTRKFLSLNLQTWVKITIDLIVTILIMPVGLIFVGFVGMLHVDVNAFEWGLILDLYTSSITQAWSTVKGEQESIEQMDVVTVSMYLTTFTTSIWLWLHGVSVAASQFVIKIPKISAHLNVENKPFLSLGIIINLVVGSTMIFILPIVAII